MILISSKEDDLDISLALIHTEISDKPLKLNTHLFDLVKIQANIDLIKIFLGRYIAGGINIQKNDRNSKDLRKLLYIWPFFV